MLGVFKRRWKPKRSNATSRIASVDPVLESTLCDKTPPRSSVRQVHPVCDEKAQPLCGDVDVSLAIYPKRASLDSNHSAPNGWPGVDGCLPPQPQCYPLAPNICVEAGRIQFIRQCSEGAVQDQQQNSAPPARITVTRGLQTEWQEDDFEDREKLLQDRIAELEIALDAAQKNELRDKQLVTRLQKQLTRRESAHRDAERERRLRADSEARTKQAVQEANRCRSRLKLLTSEFARMEETVRSMLAYKRQAEQLRQEKAALTLAFENRCQQYQNTISRLNQEILTLREQLDQFGGDLTPEGILEAQKAAIQRHAEESRKQYERCLDDVANQVVRALLAQKGLKEEVGNLNNRIQELESQNRALTSMLVHQLRGETPDGEGCYPSATTQIALQDTPPTEPSPTSLMQSSLLFKHCNSFNSEVLEDTPNNDKCDNPVHAKCDNTEKVLTKIERHFSADAEVLDARFSLEDKKRHQVLTKLWTELKGTEVTPKKLLEALSAVDSALWVPPKRPISLNLQLPIIHAAKYRRARPILAQSSSKSEEETTGNESPESGNRDEGYSTMSSDVQTDVTRSTGEAAPNRGLEDLKEATDETDLTETRLLISDNKDPDILYIPLNLLNLKSRNSYPPGKDMLPFQHIMRSFSDSHLCIKITTSPSPCYTFSSPISSSPSIFLLDICDKSKNPLRRTRATSSLWDALFTGNNNLEICDDKMSQLSWSSAADDRLDCTTWDAEYIQHWLRLDETRSALQQQHRDLFELEYDRTELEDWSLSLSSDDLREQSWRKSDAITPGQISISTLPSIQENNALELEEDANECLWNNSSYMMDKEGRELVTLLMDTSKTQSDKQWPYAVPHSASQQVSPDNSWSSGASDCQSHEPETCSKRSSAALSGCSDDTGELPAVGTDFTRDFYRLVKFESTKSLASTSSRSLGGALSENGDRETALQNVLTFIAEQQKYVAAREGKESRPCSVNEMTKDFNIEGPPQIPEELKISITSEGGIKPGDDESCVVVKQACDETSGKKRDHQDEGDSLIAQNIAYAEEICLVTPLDVESENCSNISEHPVDICSSVSVADYQNGDHEETTFESKTEININDSFISDISKSCDTTCSDISICANGSESLTSSVSTPDTVVSKIPRRKATALTPSPTKTKFSNNDTKIPKSKIPYKRMIKSKADSNKVKENIVRIEQPQPDTHVITSEKLPQSTSGVISNIIEGPPHRAVSFHERATSKDVIDELNRMIRNGDDGGAQEQTEVVNASLDHSCRSTGWIHVERDIDLTDPKARANLLDVMMASVSSDSSPTSSCGGSVASDSTEDPPDYGHLHRIHRFHRQKKANAIRPELAVVRATQLTRPTIIGRPDFFVRYGDKEKEAVASFDFLDDLSTTSSSLSCSIEESEDKAKDCYVSLNMSQV